VKLGALLLLLGVVVMRWSIFDLGDMRIWGYVLSHLKCVSLHVIVIWPESIHFISFFSLSLHSLLSSGYFSCQWFRFSPPSPTSFTGTSPHTHFLYSTNPRFCIVICNYLSDPVFEGGIKARLSLNGVDCGELYGD
jgi:hypothetical protein